MIHKVVRKEGIGYTGIYLIRPIMETPEKGIREQLIEQKYPITGRGDFESNSRDLVREIGQEKEENVYLLTNFIDDTYRFDRIADGGTGEVSFDATRLQLRK